MSSLMNQAWVVIAVIVGLGVLGIFHCAAAAIRNHHQVHDLRVRVNQLRIGQLRRLHTRGAEVVEEDGEFEVVETKPKQSKDHQRKAA
jgi:hypothetical protein